MPENPIRYTVTGGAGVGGRIAPEEERRFHCLMGALQLDKTVGGWDAEHWHESGVLTIWRTGDGGIAAHAWSAYLQLGDLSGDNLEGLPPSLAAVALQDALADDVLDLATVYALLSGPASRRLIARTIDEHWEGFGIDAITRMGETLQRASPRVGAVTDFLDIVIRGIGRHLFPPTDEMVSFLFGLSDKHLARVATHAAGDLGMATGGPAVELLRSAAGVAPRLRAVVQSSDEATGTRLENLATRIESAAVNHACSLIEAPASEIEMRLLPDQVLGRQPIKPGDDPSRLHMFTKFVMQLVVEEKLALRTAEEVLAHAVGIVSQPSALTEGLRGAVDEACGLLDLAPDLSAAAGFAALMTAGRLPGGIPEFLDASLLARGARRFGVAASPLTIDAVTDESSLTRVLETMTWARRWLLEGGIDERAIEVSLHSAHEELFRASQPEHWVGAITARGPALLKVLAPSQLPAVTRLALAAAGSHAATREGVTADPVDLTALLIIGWAVIERAVSPEDMVPAADILQWAATPPEQSPDSNRLFSELVTSMRHKLTANPGWTGHFVSLTSNTAPIVRMKFSNRLTDRGELT